MDADLTVRAWEEEHGKSEERQEYLALADLEDQDYNTFTKRLCEGLKADGFLLFWYPDTLSSREIGKGFFDIRVIDERRALVMEVKRTDNEKEDLAARAKKGWIRLQRGGAMSILRTIRTSRQSFTGA